MHTISWHTFSHLTIKSTSTFCGSKLSGAHTKRLTRIIFVAEHVGFFLSMELHFLTAICVHYILFLHKYLFHNKKVQLLLINNNLIFHNLTFFLKLFRQLMRPQLMIPQVFLCSKSFSTKSTLPIFLPFPLMRQLVSF